ncbi:hypothetical protein BJP65_13650 [Microbacterium sp. BH-3-3-3]|nr:hypothetical protein BJP65_13650 [Microbacterium sp. BH-3-3-3]
MTTCAIYARQSMDRATGIDRQLARCRALAASRGWEVVAEFEDNAVSAFKSRGAGTAWSRLLASSAEVIVSVNLDRLLRGQADLLTIIAAGKTVATVEGDLDLTTADGRFRAELLTSLATFEVNRKRERQLRSNESRVAGGLPVPGKRRFGFEPGNVIERTAEADALRKAYRDLLDGRSVRSIAAEWGRQPVRVRTILSNPSNAGWVVRGGERFEAAPEVARIIDRETWQAARDLLTDEARRVSAGPARKHLLSGIARCECGAKMHSASRYYRCSRDADHALIRREEVEDEARTWLFFSILNDRSAERVGAPAPLAARLSELEDERTRWTAVAALPGADLAQVTKELSRIAQEAETASTELGRARVDSATADLIERAEASLTSIQPHAEGLEVNAAPFFEFFDGLELDQQRTLIETRLTITVRAGRGDDRVTVHKRAE